MSQRTRNPMDLSYGDWMTEVPENDALEQAIPLDPDEDEVEIPELGIEVPEADGLEQAMPVPADEDDYS
ncbi:MAG TPA: hypothetical protein DGG94_08775 [Micromonosporaceae bacterium]|nr:hypothetical protein [Micromonosporaceae bacterium]HCU49878.1 hypothetical protein [Micromonosporaceae bacterium]